MLSPVSCMVVNTRASAPKNSMKHVTAESWPVLRFLQLVTAWISCNKKDTVKHLLSGMDMRGQGVSKKLSLEVSATTENTQYCFQPPISLFVCHYSLTDFHNLIIYRWKQGKSENPTERIPIQNKKVINIRASYVKT